MRLVIALGRLNRALWTLRGRSGVIVGARLWAAVVMLFFTACATGSAAPSPASSEPAAEVLAGVPGSAAGTWQGTTTSTSDGNAVRNITLRFFQNGTQISGSYSCIAGNSACRNLNDSGTVNGKLNGSSLAIRVVLNPDNSECFFTGTLAESAIFGQYKCLKEGQFEIGIWRVKRLS